MDYSPGMSFSESDISAQGQSNLIFISETFQKSEESDR